MSEIINAYLNTTNYIVNDVVCNIIAIVAVVAAVLFLVSASRASVGDGLPKMTKLMIDNKVLYIHRANFQIIDKDLLN